ncbi:MAG: DUF3857 domain-containing protein, partial [Bdellovibrionales bacterium]|nr:DUF3857 domain-containing protein [Bdellovibrionales bacterium]
MHYFFTFLILLSFSTFARMQQPEEASHKTLFANQAYKIKKDGSYKVIDEREIEILNETGRKDFGFIKINYNPSTSDVVILEAYTLNGSKKSQVSNSLIEDKAIASQVTGFDNTNQIAITFPEVQIGSKIHLKYSFERKIPSLKNFFNTSEFFGWKENLQNETITIESELELHHYLYDLKKIINVETNKKNDLYLMKITLKQPIFVKPVEEKNPYMQRTSTPYIEISSAQNWNYEILKSIIEDNEKILSESTPEKLNSILQQAKKIKGFIPQVNYLIENLQNSVRYFGDWRTIKGALVPRNLKVIMSTGFGDCKDYSALLTHL